MNTKIKIILIIISIPIIIYFWPTALGGDSEFLIVLGKSMDPTILHGSIVITKKLPSYQIDDIVSFTLKEGREVQRVVVHRIIDETEEGFIIKGDNNEKKDPGFPTTNDIRGKVIFVIPYVGEMLAFLRNPIVLFGSAVVIILIQAEQKRRKKRNEKLRRISLGLTPKSDKLTTQSKKEPKKHNEFTLFYVAISFNVLMYVLLQVSINNKSIPVMEMGDAVTGFIFRIFTPSLASTIVFGVYFMFIFGLYFLVKFYENKKLKSKPNPRKKSGSALELLLGKNFNPILGIAQFLWFMFIIMSLFHLLSLVPFVMQSVVDPCDPTKALC